MPLCQFLDLPAWQATGGGPGRGSPFRLDFVRSSAVFHLPLAKVYGAAITTWLPTNRPKCFRIVTSSSAELKTANSSMAPGHG